MRATLAESPPLDAVRQGAEPGRANRTANLDSMDLDLSSEHQLLRSTIRDFMEKEVAPVVDEHEREHRFPVDVVRKLGEMGWLGIPIPEDEGGAGMDTLAYAIAVEEIGRVWGSLGLIVAAHTSLAAGHCTSPARRSRRTAISSRWRAATSSRVRAHGSGRRLGCRWNPHHGSTRGRARRRQRR